MKDLNTHKLVKGDNVTCNKNILLSVISLATKEISGVASMANEHGNCISNLFARKNSCGVKIKYNSEGNLIVDVSINIFDGYSVPEVAYKVQENIKSGISSMVDVNTAQINVHVVNVEFDKKKKSNGETY